MFKHNQNGSINGLAVGLIMSVLLLFIVGGFGIWAYMSRQDYKNNTDQKISKAVKIAVEKNSTAKDKQFLEDEKKPLETYNGPSQLGGLSIKYPKTWSGYVVIAKESASATPLTGYFYPGVVPSVNDEDSRFALLVEIINRPYATEVDKINSFVEQAKAKQPAITPYSLPKVPSAIGIKIVGNLPEDRQGEMIILPLRSQTLKITAESDQYKADLENNILPNFSFLP